MASAPKFRCLMTSDSNSLLRPLMWSVPLLILVFTVLFTSFWIAVWAGDRFPNGPGEFGDVFGMANALFSGLALFGVVFAIHHQQDTFNRQIQEIQKQTKLLHAQNVHQALEAALLEYRTVEMFSAVKQLWLFHRQNQANLSEAYERIRIEDEERISKLPDNQRLDAEKLTLHFRRQLVSRFYQYLGGLAVEEVVPPELIYRYWGRGALRIIPEVLEPIEKALDNTYNLGQSNKIQLMMSLYNGSPTPDQSPANVRD